MIEDRPSPNFGPRRGGLSPDLVVLHHTAMTSADAALCRLCDPASEVSAHYLIAEDGRIWRLVPEDARAWHAGAGHWGGSGDVNSRSIGIELANPGPLAGFPPFPEPQMQALVELLTSVMQRWSIPPEAVIAHSDMAPGRKADPGPKFDWQRLARDGLAVWPSRLASEDAGWDAFLHSARRFGYGVSGASRTDVLRSFRLRFRPQAAGDDPDDVDCAMMCALAAAHPCIDGPVLPT